MPLRRRAACNALAAVVLLAGILTGGLGSATADGSTYRTLLDRAVRTLQEAEALYLGGREGEARHPARRALVLLAEAARERTQAPEPAYLAVHAAVFAGDREAAVSWMRELGQRLGPGSGDPRFHVARGLVLLYLDRSPDAAVEALERARLLAPRRPDPARDLLHYAALMAAGERSVRAGELEAALGLYRKAVQLASRMGAQRKRAAARGNAGITLLELGRHVDAEIVFRALARESPKNAIWHLFRARALGGMGRLSDAAAAWTRAADLGDAGPEDAPYRADLREARFQAAIAHLELSDEAAEAKERQARREQARGALQRYVESVPDSHRGQFVLGRILDEYFHLPHAAMRHLERAHAIDPVCDAAIRLLIRISSRVGPPPTDEPRSPAEEAAAAEAWTARRLAWEKELEANTDAWEAERRRRRERSPDGSDGCPPVD